MKTWSERVREVEDGVARTITRKKDERILLTLPDGRAVSVLVVRLSANAASIGVDAPADVPIVRGELEPNQLVKS